MGAPRGVEYDTPLRVETIRPAPKRGQYRQHTKENARRVEALPAPCVHIHAEEPKASTVTSDAPC